MSTKDSSFWLTDLQLMFATTKLASPWPRVMSGSIDELGPCSTVWFIRVLALGADFDSVDSVVVLMIELGSEDSAPVSSLEGDTARVACVGDTVVSLEESVLLPSALLVLFSIEVAPSNWGSSPDW